MPNKANKKALISDLIYFNEVVADHNDLQVFQFSKNNGGEEYYAVAEDPVAYVAEEFFNMKSTFITDAFTFEETRRLIQIYCPKHVKSLTKVFEDFYSN